MDNLQRILNISLEERRESDVTGLVFAILGEAHKDYLHGYFVRSEHHMSGGVADVTIEVLRDERKILVVECKKNPRGFIKGELQLKSYMLNGYPNGLLICGQVSRFYNLNVEDDEAEPQRVVELNNSIEMCEVIRKIREM